ncbi:MAG: DUF4912 domain-containing protein [Candidatus Omnitrophota bacterium]
MALFRKIKQKIKDLVQKEKAKKQESKRVRRAESQEIKKEILGAQEMAVEQTKFSHPETAPFRRTPPTDLPYQYDRDRMILQVRDPRWLHTYWEVAPPTIERLKNDLREDFFNAKRVLRVYDVSDIVFNGENAHSLFDIQVNEFANNWYINTQGPDRSWCVDFGLLLASGRFITIVRSNVVRTPLEGPSWITDEEWMIPDDMFARLYGMGFGLGRSSPVGKAWQERVRQVLFSGAMASPGMASMASPVKKELKQRKFWLLVDCELIVYGATEPGAKVSVQGKEVALRPDGTFTLRFALPDGRQVMPVKAVSCDKVEERTITPIVSRETKISI